MREHHLLTPAENKGDTVAEDTTLYGRIRKIVQDMNDRDSAAEYAVHMAIGIGADDPGDEPTVVAVVYQGMLHSLTIHDSITALEPDDAGMLVCTAIRLAYGSWLTQRNLLADYAAEVLSEKGLHEGAGELRREMAEHNPLD